MLTPDGITVEVKAAAYKQTWRQKKDSSIRFGIEERAEWVPEKGGYVGEPKRHAKVYVFCLLNNQVPHEGDPLDLSRWGFFVLGTHVLNEKCPRQKTIGLASLQRLEPVTCDFLGLAEAVRAAALA